MDSGEKGKTGMSTGKRGPRGKTEMSTEMVSDNEGKK